MVVLLVYLACDKEEMENIRAEEAEKRMNLKGAQ